MYAPVSKEEVADLIIEISLYRINICRQVIVGMKDKLRSLWIWTVAGEIIIDWPWFSVDNNKLAGAIPSWTR